VFLELRVEGQVGSAGLARSALHTLLHSVQPIPPPPPLASALVVDDVGIEHVDDDRQRTPEQVHAFGEERPRRRLAVSRSARDLGDGDALAAPFCCALAIGALDRRAGEVRPGRSRARSWRKGRPFRHVVFEFFTSGGSARVVEPGMPTPIGGSADAAIPASPATSTTSARVRSTMWS
jgi:hypothetical protein